MTNDMTRGNPTRLIISFTLPVLFGNLCQQLYGMVDSIIVGRAISMEALAAVGATSGISFLVIGCIQGLTAGFSVITAQRFGAGDYEGVKRSVATSALLSLAATVLLTAAAFSAASKIHMLSEQVAVSFGTAMATYAGQNYGAGKAGRVQEGLRKCALACEAITLGIMVIMTAFGGVMSSWFIDGYHPEVIQQAHLYLFISALFYPALTMLFLYRNTLLGLGNGVTPMLAGVCELLSRMIGAPVLGHFFGFTGLCWINPIAWVTASGLLFLSYRKTMRNIRPVDPTVDASDSNKIMN